MKEALKNNQLYQTINATMNHIKSWLPVYSAALIMLAEVGARVAGVFKEIKQKKEQLITELDGFANMKLGRTDAVTLANTAQKNGISL